MYYAKVIDDKIVEYPYTFDCLRRDNPGTSLPNFNEITDMEVLDKRLAVWNMCRVMPTTPPSSSFTKNIKEGTPVKVDGVWVQIWDTIDADPREITERSNDRAQHIRYERDVRLKDSDWTQLADSPVDKKVWEQYRQELRNITKQEGFPWSVQWPVKPR